MIKNDFYTTQTTEPNTGNQVTNTLNQLNIAAASNAYWLGWIKPSNTPTAFKFSSYSVSPQQIQFFDITEPNNYDIGYLSGYNTNNVTWSNIVLPNSPINTQLVRYINKLDCMGVGISYGIVALRFRVYVESGLTNDEMTGRTVREFGSPSLNTWQYMSMKDFYDFLHGDYTLQLTVQGFYSGTSTVNINMSNADEMGVVYVETTSEYNGVTYYDHIHFTIADYMFSAIRSQTSVYGTNGQSMSIVPAIGMTANDYYFVSCTNSGLKSATVGNLNFDGTWYGTTWNNNNTGFSFGVLPGNPIGTIPASLKTQSGYAIFTGNIMVWNRVNVRFEISRVFTAEDILKHLSLFPRIVIDGDAVAPNPQYSYYENHSYATHVTEDNEFLAELITGDLTDDTFKEKLRLWQWDNTEWEENDYTEEDRPPYEPEPGEEGENIGDKITRPAILSIGGTKGFITQYALNATQVGQLGQILWTSVFDTDYWKNFMFSLALDTGSFSLSSLLGFFLSLKVYPFSMVNVPSYASFGQDMYFGTGIKELHFTTNIHTINDYADYISGGWCTVTSNNFYNDYRDYVNTEITLYVPYCGTVQLNPGDVIGNKISVQYAVDFATGGCIAYVDLETGDGAAGYPIAAMHGQIGADVPLTATAAGEVAARFIGDAANAAGLIGGQVGQEIETASGALQGKFKPTPGSVGFAIGGPAGAAAGFAASVAPGLGAQALNMLTRGAVAAPILSGGRGFASFGAPQVPYIQIRRGIYPPDTNLINVAGKPAAAAATIGDLTGYIKGTVKAEGLAGVTQEEQAAIISHIAAGIFV